MLQAVRCRLTTRPTGWIVWVFPFVMLSVAYTGGKDRGWPMALFVLVIYGFMFTGATVAHERLGAFGQAHPHGDVALAGLMGAALAVIAFATITSWPLVTCGLAAAGVGLVMVPLAVRGKRQNVAPEPRGRWRRR